MGGGVFESALVHYVVVYVHRLSHLVLDDLRFLGRYDQTSNQRNGYLYSASRPPPKNQNHINSVLKTTAIRMRSYGPMAQWIRRRSTEPEIPGSIPGRINFFFFFLRTWRDVPRRQLRPHKVSHRSEQCGGVGGRRRGGMRCFWQKNVELISGVQNLTLSRV